MNPTAMQKRLKQALAQLLATVPAGLPNGPKDEGGDEAERDEPGHFLDTSQ